jgi:hypothetical protein
MCEKTVVIKKPSRFAPADSPRPPAAAASQPGQGDHELCDSLMRGMSGCAAG